MRTKKFIFILTITALFIISGCSNTTEPPEAIVKINDENIDTTRGTYHWETDGLLTNNKIVADALAPFQIAEDMEAKILKQNSVVDVEFSDGSQPQLQAYLWENEARGKELSLKEAQITLPSQTGKHVIEIIAKWPNGDASYTFVVEVQ